MNKTISLQKFIFSVICFIIYVSILFLILNYSLENGNQSKDTSDKVTDVISGAINNVTNGKADVKKHILSEYVRKIIGHFGLFALSSFFGFLAFVFIFKFKYLKYVIVLIIGISLSIITEFIQNNVSGRILDVKDIIINISGVVTGIIVSNLIYLGIISIIIRKNKNNLHTNYDA